MKNISLILPISAGIMFGSVGLFVRVLTDFGMSNPTVLFVRTLFAALLMLIYLLVYNKKLLQIKAKDLLLFFGTGLLGMMCLNLCYNIAVNSLSLSLSAVLLSTAPIFVVAFAAVLFKEKITVRKVLCMVLVIIGCVFASGLLESATGTEISVTGLLFGIGSAFFYALYSIFSRLATDKGYHTYTIIFYSVALITIVLLPLADLEVVGSYVSEAPLKNLFFLCLHGLCTSVLPYIFITMSLIYVGVGKVSIIASGLEPIAAAGFGIIFYTEIPTVLVIIGVLVTIVALALLCSEKETFESN